MEKMRRWGDFGLAKRPGAGVFGTRQTRDVAIERCRGAMFAKIGAGADALGDPAGFAVARPGPGGTIQQPLPVRAGVETGREPSPWGAAFRCHPAPVPKGETALIGDK